MTSKESLKSPQHANQAKPRSGEEKERVIRTWIREEVRQMGSNPATQKLLEDSLKSSENKARFLQQLQGNLQGKVHLNEAKKLGISADDIIKTLTESPALLTSLVVEHTLVRSQKK